jgi:hypothetical protein
MGSMNSNAVPRGNMMNRNYVVILWCALVLAGCAASHRYELSKDNAGRLVRLDTQTGEVTLIEGEKLTPIPAAAATEAQSRLQDSHTPQLTLPDGGKSWRTLSLPELGDSSARLTSYWRNGELHYVLELYPLKKRLRLVYNGYYTNASFSMMVSDTAGKQVARADLPTSHLKRTINKTQSEEELSAEGVIPMSKEDYDSLASWQLLWNP